MSTPMDSPNSGGVPLQYAAPGVQHDAWLKQYLAEDPMATARAALWLGAWRVAGLYVDPRNTDKARIRFAWTADVEDGVGTNVQAQRADGPGFYRAVGHLHMENIGRRLRYFAKLDHQWREPEASDKILLTNVVALAFDTHDTPTVQSVLVVPTPTWDAIQDWLALLDCPHPIYRDLHRNVTEDTWVALRLDEVERAYRTPFRGG